MHKCTLPPKHIPRSVALNSRQNGNFFSHTTRPNVPRIRSFSTSRVQCSNITTSQAELATTRHEALTLQHKTENLLESVFKVGERPSDLSWTAETREFWRDILSDTFENLSTAAERSARVVGKVRLFFFYRNLTITDTVFGMDEWSGAEDLVTALLEEPLSSDQAQEDALRNRWKNAHPSNRLTIS